MLTLADLPRYLCERDVLTAADVVTGNFVAWDVSRRNRNFRVEQASRPVLVKQAMDAVARVTLANEASVCRMFRRHPVAGPLVPEVVEYEPSQGVLLQELIFPARSVLAYHQQRRTCPTSVGAAIGHALAVLHQAGTEAPPGVTPPFRARLHKPSLDIFAVASQAQLEVVRVIQNTAGVTGAIDDLREVGTDPTVLHGDVRWDNILLVSVPGRRPRVRFVDWELAAWGSRWWDVGAAFANYLSWWLWSIPSVAGQGPDGLITLAQTPLAAVRPAIAALWAAYCRTSRPTVYGWSDVVETTARTGYRLLGAAFEMAQRAERLSSTNVLHLQLGANLLLRPAEACVRLLGFTPEAV